MDDCIFCKIIEGKIPCSKVFESKDFLAFMDINPVNFGHVLVVPKKHFANYLEIPDEILKEYSVVVKTIAKAVKEGAKADGINIGMNNFKAAGQVVFHAHMHVIPRFDNDGLKPWPFKKYEGDMMEEVRARIAKLLKN